jgi:hypothetical protein
MLMQKSNHRYKKRLRLEGWNNRMTHQKRLQRRMRKRPDEGQNYRNSFLTTIQSEDSPLILLKDREDLDSKKNPVPNPLPTLSSHITKTTNFSQLSQINL